MSNGVMDFTTHPHFGLFLSKPKVGSPGSTLWRTLSSDHDSSSGYKIDFSNTTIPVTLAFFIPALAPFEPGVSMIASGLPRCFSGIG